MDIRFQDVDGEGSKDYVATGTHACTCGASVRFDWVYVRKGRELRLSDSYMLGRPQALEQP